MVPNSYVENHDPYSNHVEVVYNSLFASLCCMSTNTYFEFFNKIDVATIIGVMKPHVDNINNFIRVVKLHPFSSII